jgi:hypothetical protein
MSDCILKVLVPIPITFVPDTQLITSTVAEPFAGEPAAYSSGTTYADGALVRYNHYIYESLQGTNLNHAPDEVNSLWWLRLQPTERWKMFDTKTSTVTNSGTGSMTVRIKPGQVFNSLALVGISGVNSVNVKMYNGLTLISDETQTLDNSFISDWYQYFFDPFDIKNDLLFGPFLPYYNAELEITFTGTGPVQCGGLLVGTTAELGTVRYGAGAGIIDYSKVETDDFGITTLIQRNFARRTNMQIELENTQLRRVYSTLSQLRATPAVWIGSDNYIYSPLVVYGVFKDFNIEIAYPLHSLCSIEIQGLT